MRAISNDLRERVWRACQEDDLSWSEAADGFGVSRSFVAKLLRRYRDEATLAAKPRGGNRRPTLGRGDMAFLRRAVVADPDATLAEWGERLKADRGVEAGVWTVCRALQKLGLPRKKSRSTPASGTRLGCGPCAGPSPAN